MGLFFEEEGQAAVFDLECEKLAGEVIEETLNYEGCPYETEVELLLTDNAGIRILNMQYREIDCATDVLSFPMIDFGQPGEFEWLEEADEYFNPESGELILGNIVVSKQKVLEQSEAYGHSVKREYAFLIVHSVLHLLGYDHMTDEEREIMERKQKEIMNHLNIQR